MSKLETLTVTVPTAGTAVPASSEDKLVAWIICQADPTNTNGIAIGDVNVDMTNGMELDPTDAPLSIPMHPNGGSRGQFNLANLYVDADTSGNSLKILAYVVSNRD